jgi:hypothetical protein
MHCNDICTAGPEQSTSPIPPSEAAPSTPEKAAELAQEVGHNAVTWWASGTNGARYDGARCADCTRGVIRRPGAAEWAGSLLTWACTLSGKGPHQWRCSR